MHELNTGQETSGEHAGCVEDGACSRDEDKQRTYEFIVESPEIQLATEWAHLGGG